MYKNLLWKWVLLSIEDRRELTLRERVLSGVGGLLALVRNPSFEAVGDMLWAFGLRNPWTLRKHLWTERIFMAHGAEQALILALCVDPFLSAYSLSHIFELDSSQEAAKRYMHVVSTRDYGFTVKDYDMYLWTNICYILNVESEVVHTWNTLDLRILPCARHFTLRDKLNAFIRLLRG